MDPFELLEILRQVNAELSMPSAIVLAALALGLSMALCIFMLCGTFMVWRFFAGQTRLPERTPYFRPDPVVGGIKWAFRGAMLAMQGWRNRRAARRERGLRDEPAPLGSA